MNVCVCVHREKVERLLPHKCLHNEVDACSNGCRRGTGEADWNLVEVNELSQTSEGERVR